MDKNLIREALMAGYVFIRRWQDEQDIWTHDLANDAIIKIDAALQELDVVSTDP
jgi:hypothetical protein